MTYFPLRKGRKEKRKNRQENRKWDLLEPFLITCDILMWPIRLFMAFLRVIGRSLSNIFEFIGDLLSWI